MKSPRFPFVALAFALATVSVPAQIVHLSLRGSPTTGFDFGGSYSGPMSLDIYYDSELELQTLPWGLEYYAPTDAVNNFWRLRFNYTDESGDLHAFDLSRPITFLQAGESGFFATDGEDWEYKGFAVGLAWFANAGANLPVPPIALNLERDRSNYFVFMGAQLEVPSDEAWKFGFLADGLSLVTAELGPRFTAIPEPATYGWFATGGLIALLAYRRRREAAAA